MAQVRKRGKAAIVICSKPFQAVARNQLRIDGAADLPLVLIDHPVGGIVEASLRDRVGQAVPQVLQHLRSIVGS